MKATLTEEKAKEILDFLAKKYRYAGFENLDKIDLDEDEVKRLAIVACVVVKDDNKKVDSKEVNSLDYLFRKTKKQMNYKSILEFMLDIVSAGYNIGAFYHRYGDYMLKSHTTLEEILVEIDLNKIEERNESGES